MEYRITNHYRKTTKTNKPFISADLQEAGGKSFERVAIWSNFPGFEQLANGSTVQGTLEDKGFGLTLNPGLMANRPMKSGGASSAAIGLAQERKAENIKEAQTTKEMSIKLAGAMRDSTLIVTALWADIIKDVPAEQRRDRISEELGYWRTKLLEDYEENKGEIPF